MHRQHQSQHHCKITWRNRGQRNPPLQTHKEQHWHHWRTFQGYSFIMASRNTKKQILQTRQNSATFGNIWPLDEDESLNALVISADWSSTSKILHQKLCSSICWRLFKKKTVLFQRSHNKMRSTHLHSLMMLHTSQHLKTWPICNC